MQTTVGDVVVHHVEHGEGAPVLVLHGAGVDHREVEACVEPALHAYGGLRRIYPDLPGTGRTSAPLSLQSADDVLDVLCGFVDAVAGREPVLVVGHSVGGYFGLGLATRRPDRVAGLALLCPLLADVHDVGEHTPVVAADDIGDDGFRGYFVVQTAAMLERYERFVAPALALVDVAAAERIGSRWQLDGLDGPPYDGPVLVVAGRQDSVVGHAAAADLLGRHPGATLAVLDRAGHALPHEQPELLAALLHEWVDRVRPGPPPACDR